MQPHDALLTTALQLHAAGCCVIPTKPDGTKAPAVNWKTYQHQRPDENQLHTWFTSGHYDGLGVVCGTVSGGLEMLEVEGRAADQVPELGQLLTDHGATDLWDRLRSGYVEQTPSGGFHFVYRIDHTDGARPAGNTKLARRPGPVDPATGRAGVDVLWETRGEGGYVVVAPSAGRTHPSGQAWTMIAGGPATIPVLTTDERDLLHALVGTFDAMPVAGHHGLTSSSSNSNAAPAYDATDGLRPGDDFNARATWDDILTPHGWQRCKPLAGGWAWTRPGKHPRDGFSATTGTARDGVDRLYVFSTSTDFETETPYSKFAAHALLNHGGDLSAAASALRAAGYGDQTEPGPTLSITGVPEHIREATEAHTQEQVRRTADRAAGYGLHDVGNQLRLVDTYGDTVRYVPQRGAWITWNGHRWTWDDAGQVREHAKDIAATLPDSTKAEIAHRQRSHSANGITNMVKLAQTDPRIVAPINTLDAHPFELNTPGGVVDLRTGQLYAPDPTKLHTRSTTVTPDPTTHAPRWERFLAETFAGDPQLNTYVQRLLGITLVGQVLEQILPFAHGAGANGKTTLLGAFQRIIGIGDHGYAISAPAEILIATRNNDHPATIAQISGARMVVTSELEDGQRFAEARVKQLTGRDAINARFMRQNPFTFMPTHTLWLAANHKPDVRTGGPAMWRRLRLLPFLHTVPPEQRDPHLEDVLAEQEGPAVLAWAIRGAADYLTQGLPVPASVADATAAYEADQDTLGRFVDDCCELGPAGAAHMRTKVSEIRIAYESWCHVEGETPMSAKAFTTGLRTRFDVVSERVYSGRWYLGIRLTDPEPVAAPGGSEQLRWDQQ